MERKLTIAFGALSPKLSNQLRKQKFKFDKDKVKVFEKIAESILWLMFHSMVTDKQRDTLYIKLRKKIVSHVKSKNP